MQIEYLPLEVRLEFACYHSGASKHPLWQLDTATGHMVCSLCGKPAPDLVFRICVECGKQFVLELTDPNWQPKVFMVGNKVFQRDFECATCF